MRPWLLLAALLACEAPAPDLALDLPQRCAAIELEVREPALLPGWTVHAVAALNPDGSEGWALATDPQKKLRIQPLPDGESEDLSGLGEVDEFELLAGPTPGQAWLVHDRPDRIRLWRLGSATRPEVLEAPDIGNFPGGEAWTRRLVFVDETPYVLAAPRSGDASTLQLPLARLDRESLAVVDAWKIEFWWTCSLPADVVGAPEDVCVETPYDEVASMQILGTTQPDAQSGSVVLFGLDGVEPGDAPESEGAHHTVITTLELRGAGPDAAPDAYRQDWNTWVDRVPLAISSAQVATDREGVYVLTGVTLPPDAAQPATQDFLISNDHADERGDDVGLLFALDKQLRSLLLQIDDSVALGQFLADELRIAPIDDHEDEVTQVDESLIAGLPVPEGTVVRGAGFGLFLVRPPADPARLVAPRCVEGP